MELQPRKYTTHEQQQLSTLAAQILPAIITKARGNPDVGAITHTQEEREQRVDIAFLYASDILRRVGAIK